MSETPNWTAFRTAGALLALSPQTSGETPRVELTFGTSDIDGLVSAMQSHGLSPEGGVQAQGWGRTARFHDPEGNTLTVNQLSQDFEAGDGLPLGAAIIHTRDMAAAKAFYHHALGLKLRMDEPGWVEFEAGGARGALRDHAAPNGRPITFGFEIEGLMQWAEDARNAHPRRPVAARDFPRPAGRPFRAEPCFTGLPLLMRATAVCLRRVAARSALRTCPIAGFTLAFFSSPVFLGVSRA